MQRYNNINKKLLVAIAGICLKDSCVYITQQDAPHKNKIKSLRSTIDNLFLFFVSKLLTTLNSLLAKYDDGNTMKNLFDAAHKAGYNTGICL
jgi:hypothetical protein